jgi:uncharacterized membrane protein YdbT with pleckstrin-like domain
MLLWSDKKRIFGLPISFTHYKLEDGRLHIKKGLFSTHYDELMLYRVFDIKMVETFGQKLFGVGTIILYTNDASSPEKILKIENIKKPLNIKVLISDEVEKARDQKGIHAAEFIGV